jgi:hypothetical protein
MFQLLKSPAALLLVLFATAGCGTTKSRTATQQLLLSDAVDQAVASIDFRPLAGQRIYLDETYVDEIKNYGFVNAKYVISSLRQQMVAAHCLLQAKPEDADIIVEARVGTVGSDGNELVYGLPASNGLSTAATLITSAPPIPAIPEISLGRKNTEIGAAKVALFAYHRETRTPIWQSGVARAKSTAQDLWVFGAGPFQRGTIYSGIRLAGQPLPLTHQPARGAAPSISYHEPHLFDPLTEPPDPQRRMAELLESLPVARPDEWLTPLDPAPPTPLEETLWR